MASIKWDQAGDRVYESGVDHGVLYLENGTAVPWNGIVSVVEKFVGNESTPIYFDGVKFGDAFSPGDYAGTLRAYTYPEEFLAVEGQVNAGNGLILTNQRPQRFGLSYRTKIGSDTDPDAGYKIHVLYNLIALPSTKTYQTSAGVDASVFEWNILAVPEEVPGFRPTAHIVLDTRFMGELLLKDLEETLYGNDAKDAKLPALSTLVSFISGWVIIRITDNLDGTWTATGPDNYFEMLDETTFQINEANAVYLDSETYVVTDSTY